MEHLDQEHRHGHTDDPHAHNGDIEGPAGIACAAEHAAGYRTDGQQGLGKGFDAQHLRAQLDDRRIVNEQIHDLRCKDKHRGAGNQHDQYAEAEAPSAELIGQILLSGAQALGNQGGCRNRKAEHRHIAQRLTGIGQLIGGQRNRSAAGNQRRHHQLTDRNGGTLQTGGHAQLDGLTDNLAVEAELITQADANGGIRAEQRHEHTGAGEGRRSGSSRGSAGNAHTRAGDGEAHAQHFHRTGGIDQQEIQDHVDDVGHDVKTHGRFGIAAAAQDGGTHHQRRIEDIDRADNPQVRTRHRLHRCVRAHPAGQIGCNDQLHHQCDGCAHYQGAQHGLPDGVAGVFQLAFTDAPAHDDRKAHAHSTHNTQNQPDGGGIDANGRSGVGGAFADGAHHCGIHIVDGGLQQLLYDGGPSQHQNDFPGRDAAVQQIHRFAHSLIVSLS